MIATTKQTDRRVAVIKALAHPTRLRIAQIVAGGESCVCEIHAEVGGDFSTVSKHLALMREEPSKPLIELLQRLGLARGAQVRALHGRVRRLARELPLFESVWVDAMAQARMLTPYQASEINVWLPLTRVYGANTLWAESVPGKGDFRPFDLAYGQAAVFYGNRCRHYTMANTTPTTRVSVDFRVVPGQRFEADPRRAGAPGGSSALAWASTTSGSPLRRSKHCGVCPWRPVTPCHGESIQSQAASRRAGPRRPYRRGPARSDSDPFRERRTKGPLSPQDPLG